MLLTRKNNKSESVCPLPVKEASGSSPPLLLHRFHDLTNLVNPDTSISQFQQKAADYLRLHTRSSYVECLVKSGSLLHLASQTQHFKYLPLDPNDSLAAYVATTLKSVTTTNSHTSPYYQQFPNKIIPVSSLTGLTIKPRSVACLPMVDTRNKLQGVLQLFNKLTADDSQTFYSTQDMQAITEIATLLAESLRTKKRLQKAEQKVSGAVKVVEHSIRYSSEVLMKDRAVHALQQMHEKESINTEAWTNLVVANECDGGALFRYESGQLNTLLECGSTVAVQSIKEQALKEVNYGSALVFTKWCFIEACANEPAKIAIVPLPNEAVAVLYRNHRPFDEPELIQLHEYCQILKTKPIDPWASTVVSEEWFSFNPNDNVDEVVELFTQTAKNLVPRCECSVYLGNAETQQFWVANSGSQLNCISFEQASLWGIFSDKFIRCVGTEVGQVALSEDSWVLIAPILYMGRPIAFLKLERCRQKFKKEEGWLLGLLVKHFAVVLESFRCKIPLVKPQPHETVAIDNILSVRPHSTEPSFSYGVLEVLMKSPQNELLNLEKLFRKIFNKKPIQDALKEYLGCTFASAYIIKHNALVEIGTSTEYTLPKSIEAIIEQRVSAQVDCETLEHFCAVKGLQGLFVPIFRARSIQGGLLAAGPFPLTENSVFLAEFAACLLGEVTEQVHPVACPSPFLDLANWSRQLMIVLNYSVLRYTRCKRIIFSALTDSLEVILAAALNLITDCTRSTHAKIILCEDGYCEEFTAEAFFSCIEITSEIQEVVDALQENNMLHKGSLVYSPLKCKDLCFGYLQVSHKSNMIHSQVVPFTTEDLEHIQEVAGVVNKLLANQHSITEQDLMEASSFLKDLATRYQETPLFQVIQVAAKSLSQSDCAYLFKVKNEKVQLLAQDTQQFIDTKQIEACVRKLLLSSEELICIRNPEEHSTFNNKLEFWTKVKIRSLCLLPLRNSLQEKIGVILLVNPRQSSSDILEPLSQSISCVLESWLTHYASVKDHSTLEQILNTLANYVLIFNEDKELVYTNQPINELLGIEFQTLKSRSEFLFSANPGILKDFNAVYDNVGLKIRKVSQTILPKQLTRQNSHDSNGRNHGRVFNYSIMRLQDCIKSKPSSRVMMILEDSSAFEAIKSDFQAINDKLRSIVNPIYSATPLQTSIKSLESLLHSIDDPNTVTVLDSVIHTLKSGRLPETKVEMVPEATSLTTEAINSLINIYSHSDQHSICPEQLSLCARPTQPHLQEFLLDDLRNWGLNVFEVTDRTQYIIAMFTDFNLLECFDISQAVLRSFARDLEDICMKKNNPFHNFLHCFNVMHATYILLASTPAGSYLTSLNLLALLVAALCHDVDHTGRTNAFEVNSRSALALRYHDKSVLENHHAAVAFQVLTNDQSNILKTLAIDQYKEIRKLIVYCILGTDMSKHAGMMSSLTERFNELDEEPLGSREKDIPELCRFLLHCGDLSHCTKPFEVYEIWSRLVCQEFIDQYSEESRLGLPQTQFYKDLSEPKVYYSNEVGFLAFVITPLWKCVNLLLSPHIEFAMNGLEKNIAIMKKKLEKWTQAEGKQHD